MAAGRPTRSIPVELNPDEIGLFLDVDGTLLDIAPRPEAVEVKAGLLDDLAAVERRFGGAVALVSGRPIAELDRLFAALRLAASGVHGAELRRRPDGGVTLLADGRLGDDAWRMLEQLLGEFRGSYAEDKGVSFAVHYPEPGTDTARLKAALQALMTWLSASGKAVRLIAGHAVFELQLQGFDKGRAIRRFMKQPPFLGRRPIFLGDDEIDRAGFDAALAQGGLAFSVGAEFAGVSGNFSGPAAVRAWLHELSR